MKAQEQNQKKTFYLSVNKQGVTQPIKISEFKRQPQKSYRQVLLNDNFTLANGKDANSNELYVDEYQIDIGQQFQNNCEELIIRRLGSLYAKNKKTAFIDIELQPTKPKDSIKIVNQVQNYPHLVEQISLFATKHYAGFFITQDFTKNGKYTVIINNEGRFQVYTVDDRIPIDKKTLQPIWGLSYERPWEMILVKAWAKKLSGYHKVLASKPFEFIEAFSHSTWKYFNLTKTEKSFLDKYLKFSMRKEAKILLKTKDQEIVCSHGLQPNSLAYQICGGNIQEMDKSIPSHMIAINSSHVTQWQGQNGFLDKKCYKLFKEMNPDLHLNRGFMMSGEDAINNFASAHITSLRQKNFITGFKDITIAANQTKAQYFYFNMLQEGFFDFCIKQFQENIVAATGEQGANSRYRHMKYMLIRDNGEQKQGVQSVIHNRPVDNSNIYVSNANEYKRPRFQVYQIEYSKGYNKGDAHFLTLQKGKYIFRIKSQTSTHLAKYSINWVCSSKIDIVEDILLTEDQKKQLLHDSFVSIMHKSQHYSFEKGKRTEMISYGNKFLLIGYGFVAVKSTKQSPYSIVVQVDPNELKKQGYALKGKYKKEKQVFRVSIEKGQYESFVMKMIPESKKYQWPTKGFKIWKKLNQQIEEGVNSSRINQSNLRSNTGQSNLRGQDSRKIEGSKLNNTQSKIYGIPEQEEENWGEVPHHQEKPQENPRNK